MNDKKRKPWLYRVDEEYVNQINITADSELLDNIEIEVYHSMLLKPFEPNDFLPHYYFTLKYNHYDLDNEYSESKTIDIGWAEAVILDPFANDEDLYEMCDAESGDLLDACFNIFDEDEDLREPLIEYSPSPVCLLSEFIVEKQFESVKREFLTWIIDYLANFSPILITLPIPTYMHHEPKIKKLERDFDENRVVSFRQTFTNHGFLPLRDSDYMYHVYDYSRE